MKIFLLVSAVIMGLLSSLSFAQELSLESAIFPNKVVYSSNSSCSGIDNTLDVTKSENGLLIAISTCANGNLCSISGRATSLDAKTLTVSDKISGSTCTVKISKKNWWLNTTVLEGCGIYFCGSGVTLNSIFYYKESKFE